MLWKSSPWKIEVVFESFETYKKQTQDLHVFIADQIYKVEALKYLISR